jgi:hypothetical protein
MTPQFRFKLKQYLATLGGLPGWVNHADGGDDWTLGATPSIVFNAPGDESNLLIGVLTGAEAGVYSIETRLDIAATGSVQIVVIQVSLLDDAFAVIATDNVSYSSSGDKIFTTSLDSPTVPAYVSIKAEMGAPLAGAFTRTITINRVTLNGSEQIIREPIGWAQAVIKMERDSKFHSMVEFFEMPLELYGASLITVRNLEAVFGIDYKLGMSVEIKYDEDTGYELLFDGLIDIAPIEERNLGSTPYRAKLVLMRNDLWAKLMSNKDIPVDVKSETDLFGVGVTPMQHKTLSMPSQKIRYEGEYRWKDHYQQPEVGLTSLIQFDWDEVVKDDIKKFNINRDVFSDDLNDVNIIPGIFSAPWDGNYTFDIRIEFGTFYPFDGGPDSNTWIDGGFTRADFYIGISSMDQTTPQFKNYRKFTYSNTVEAGGVLELYEFNGSLRLLKGQQVIIFARYYNDGFSHTIFGSRLKTWFADNIQVMTTENIALVGSQTIDGVLGAALVDLLIAVNNQDDKTENGIWIMRAGAWDRAALDNTQLQNGAFQVQYGDTWAGTYWIQQVENIDIGVTEIEFALTEYDDTKLTAYPGPGTPDTHLIITADTLSKTPPLKGS